MAFGIIYCRICGKECRNSSGLSRHKCLEKRRNKRLGTLEETEFDPGSHPRQPKDADFAYSSMGTSGDNSYERLVIQHVGNNGTSNVIEEHIFSQAKSIGDGRLDPRNTRLSLTFWVKGKRHKAKLSSEPNRDKIQLTNKRLVPKSKKM